MTITPSRTYTFDWASVRKIVLKAVIGAVIAAAAVAIIAVITGTFGILEGKLLLIILLFILFVLLALFDAEVVAKSSEGFALAGIITSGYLLLAGVFKIAIAPAGGGDGTAYSGDYNSDGGTLSYAFGQWVTLVLIARAALGLAQLVVLEQKAWRFEPLRALSQVTISVIGVLAVLLSFPVLFDQIHYADLYYRLIGVAVILMVLGMVLIPLLGRFFGERVNSPRPTYGQQSVRPAAAPAPAVIPAATTEGDVSEPTPAAPAPKPRLAWPRLEDGTPLPQGPDGKPDYSVLQNPPV